jgi:hypothetical protein
MKRKWILALTLMLAAALLTVGIVAAHPGGPNGPQRRGAPRNVMLVTALSGDQITGETLGGESVTFSVNADTAYHSPEGEASFADIAVGGYIGAKLSEDGTLAEAIAILPEDFDPANLPERGQGARRGRRGLGQVTAVGADSITIETPRGESHEIMVTDETVYMTVDGEEASLSDVVVGNWIAAHIVGDGDGNPVAAKVVLLPDDFEPGERPLDGDGPPIDGAGYEETQS